MHMYGPQLFVAGPLILHDDTRPHIVDVVTKKLRYYGWEVLHHAPYSPDMSPPDLDFFPKVKKTYAWKTFFFSGRVFYRAIRHMNKSCVLAEIIILPKRWDSVIEKQGDFIEGSSAECFALGQVFHCKLRH